MFEFWSGLSRGARAGLIAGLVVIAVGFGVAAWWALRTDYQVLFADLKPQDAQVMVAELDQQKIPYRLVDGGATLLVDGATVHATRLKLMGRDLPLHGAVGFELFNTSDFGMTEFAQKINFQRALQGELTRTIMSLAEIEEARVHLAMPEQGLFRQATSSPKASITVTLHPGQTLRPEQITGIQRLVAAAVPGMNMQDVTLVDQRGVALSRSAGEAGTADSGTRLELKRDMENYLSRKATTVLDRLFGPGQAIASVDLMLNMDQVRVTTEDVLASPARGGVAGVVVREKETAREPLAPLDAAQERTRGAASGSRETEYAVGRRVEQVIGQPGSVRRLQVVAVVRRPLDAAQEEQVRKLVATAVGAMSERGDTVVVQPVAAFNATREDVDDKGAVGATDGSPLRPVGMGADSVTANTATTAEPTRWNPVLALGVVLAAALLMAAWLLFGRRRDDSTLSEADRNAALAHVRSWLGGADAPHAWSQHKEQP